MSTPTDRLVRRYWASMVSAVYRYEEQKARFDAVKGAYRERHDRITADLRAASDPRLTEASGLSYWYRDEALMYAAVISALRADEPVMPAFGSDREDPETHAPLPMGVEGHRIGGGR